MERKRPSFREIYMRMALMIAERSTCVRLQVGCVITSVDFRKVLSLGYNGNASGLPNKCDGTEPGQCGCFVSGTRVLPAPVTRAYRRWYEGEVVRVITTAGEFTVTPNHPILSLGKGWSPTESFCKGDYLLGTKRGENALGWAVNDQEGVPIEEVFESVSVSGSTIRRTGTSHDFHGDGVLDEDVDVVSTNGCLLSGAQPGSLHLVSQPTLSTSNIVSTSFSSSSPTGQFIGPIEHKSGFKQPVTDDNNPHPIPPCQGDSRFSRFVGFDDLGDGELNHGLPFVPAEVLSVLSKHSSCSQTFLNGGVRDSKIIGNRKDSLASCVAAHEITHVERKRWSGHVYNLETLSNWYSLQVGGIIAHNCLHGEANAIINCDTPRHVQKIVFCSHLPCKMCAKSMVNLGNVELVYYHTDYRLKDGLDILHSAGIKYEQLVVNNAS